MAQNAALATAGTETLGAQTDDLDGLLDNLIVPADGTPSVAPIVPVQQTQPTQAQPQVVRIGEEDIPVQEAKLLLARGRVFETEFARLQEQASQQQAAMQMYQTFSLMEPEDQQRILDLAEAIADGKPSGSSLPVSHSAIAIPSDASLDIPKWEDMSDGERVAYTTALQVRVELKQLAGIVNGMKQYLGQVHSQSQDEKIAKALRLHGVTITADGVKELRDNGISDPMKAIPFLKSRQAGAKQATGVKSPPPEAPVSGQDNVFDDDDPNLTTDEMARLIAKGMIPKSGLSTAK